MTAPTHRENRRASRRLQGRRTMKLECRKGSLGLGRDIGVRVLDISQTGARVLLKAPLERGQEAELVLDAGHGGVVKRLATVVWSAPAEGGCYCVGFAFNSYLDYNSLLRLSAPPRELT